MEFHLLCGIPGCGKSTLVSRLPGYVVSTDQIRKFLWNDESDLKHDKLVFKVAEMIIRYMLAHQHDVILDSTNITKKKRMRYIRLAKRYDAEVTIHWVKCSLEKALAQNALRERHVPEKVIAAMFRGFQPPSVEEGADHIKIYEHDGQEVILSVPSH